MMDLTNRRTFIKAAGTAALTLSMPGRSFAQVHSGKTDMPLGLASYTLRKFKTPEAIAMAKRLGVEKICFKDMHMPLNASAAEIQETVAQVHAAGLQLYAAGVIYMTNEQEVERAFAYAQAAGLRMIVGVPEHHLLGLCDKKVRETGIMLAIHNHGPGDQRYASPGDAYNRIGKLDKRIGLCLDIGHTMRINEDPAEAAKKYFDRILDVHIKDVSAASPEGTTVEVGRGVIDVVRFLKTLYKLDYQGVLALEFEKDETDPLPGCAESIGYIRGVMAML